MVQQYRALWAIPNAGPSMSTFHFQASSELSAQAAADNVRAFFNAITGYIPNEVTIAFDTEVTTMDTATGQLTGSIPVTAPPTVTGDDTGPWAGGSGFRVVWATGAIVAGRRVRGSTFLVPAAGQDFTTGGVPSSAARSAINSAAQTLIDAGAGDSAELQVWSRPRPGRPGSVHNVVSATLSPLPATLRGRKY